VRRGISKSALLTSDAFQGRMFGHFRASRLRLRAR
jgi:hypothetical protein